MINAKELLNRVFSRRAEERAFFEQIRTKHYFSARIRPIRKVDKEALLYFRVLFNMCGVSASGYAIYLLVDNRTQEDVEKKLRHLGFTDKNDVMWLELRSGNIALAVKVNTVTLEWFINRKMERVFENNAEIGIHNGIIYEENNSYVTERDFQKAQ
jgi:hypothetical protein